MLDTTSIDRIQIDLDRKFALHRDVIVYLRDGTGDG
jgi:hypothetical protein